MPGDRNRSEEPELRALRVGKKRRHGEEDDSAVGRSSKRKHPRSAGRVGARDRLSENPPEPSSHRRRAHDGDLLVLAQSALRNQHRDDASLQPPEEPGGKEVPLELNVQHGANPSAAPGRRDVLLRTSIRSIRTSKVFGTGPEQYETASPERQYHEAFADSTYTSSEPVADKAGAPGLDDRSDRENGVDYQQATSDNEALTSSYTQGNLQDNTTEQLLNLQANAFQDFDNSQNFNLDFSTIDNSDVLENFDFDSFLNNSTEDAFNFDGSMAVGNFTLDPVDYVRETKPVERPAAPMSIRSVRFGKKC